MIVLTDIPKNKSGTPDYSAWSRDFATYLGDEFEFSSQDRDPAGFVLKFTHPQLFNTHSIFGGYLYFLLKVTEDKTAGELLSVYIEPKNNLIPGNFANISCTQFIDKKGLAMAAHYLIMHLLDYYIRNYLKAFNHTDSHDVFRITTEQDLTNIELIKELVTHEDIMGWNADTKFSTNPLSILFSTLLSFGYEEKLEDRKVTIDIEGISAKRTGTIKYCFRLPKFLRNPVY